MTKREKIIVGVMCLTIVYGAYELIGTRGVKKNAGAPAPVSQAGPAEETRKFVTDMTQRLVADRTQGDIQHTVKQASSEWTKDPFLYAIELLDSKAPEQTPPKKAALHPSPEPGFSFTGFLQAGKTNLAIINGMEYAVGDVIGNGGHRLESISPERVVIGDPNGNTIQLTLSETD